MWGQISNRVTEPMRTSDWTSPMEHPITRRAFVARGAAAAASLAGAACGRNDTAPIAAC